MRRAGAPGGAPSQARSIAASSGSGFITMPWPPPYGVSSTVRCRSLVKSRGLTKSTSTSSAARALPSRLAASGESNSSGNSVTTVKRMAAGRGWARWAASAAADPILRDALGRVDDDAAPIEVDVDQELVDHGEQPLDRAVLDHQPVLRAGLDPADHAPVGAVRQLDAAADQIGEQHLVVAELEVVPVHRDRLA